MAMISSETIRHAFTFFDTDGSGTISSAELKAILCRKTDAGTHWQEDDAEKLLASLDTNGDGVLQYEEFADAVRNDEFPGGAAYLSQLAARVRTANILRLGTSVPGWTTAIDTKGNAYFANERLGLRQWQAPVPGSGKLPVFPMAAPMLVMPLGFFFELGRIHKSTAAWREEAFANGWLEEFDAERHVCIFVSHTWWDRSYVDSTNDPNDQYDKGAPDYQDDYPAEERIHRAFEGDYAHHRKFPKGEARMYQRSKNLKFEVIKAAVMELLAGEGIEGVEADGSNVVLWIDWQSIYQDDKGMKGKGVSSLIKYVTMSSVMLVVTEEESLEDGSRGWVDRTPGYGGRG